MFGCASVALAEEVKLPYRTLTGHTGSVLCVRFTDEGKTLVSSSRDRTIKVWDVATGLERRTLTLHTADIYALAFSHDRGLMASGSVDTRTILWDPKTFEPIRILEGHTAGIREMQFSPDDKTLASVGEDNTFRLWDVANEESEIGCLLPRWQNYCHCFPRSHHLPMGCRDRRAKAGACRFK